jgi:mono/diheme cytochrome c family protein
MRSSALFSRAVPRRVIGWVALVGLTVGAGRVLAAAAPAAVPVVQAPPAADDPALVAEPDSQSHEARPGDTEHTFHFRLRNASSGPVVITDVKTSCGCTVARMPSRPWVLPPGGTGDLQLVFDLRGKSGTVIKTATVETERGRRLLTMQTRIPFQPAASTDPQMRERNQALAKADRQAVFSGDCARCHAVPTVGLTGESLFKAACGICHEAAHRASFVPGLRDLQRPAERDYWRTMVVAGKHGTLMPGFSTDMGGPLTRAQIDSLVDYLVATYAMGR